MLPQLELLTKKVDWTLYQRFEPGLDTLLRDLLPLEARVCYELLSSTKPERIAAVRTFFAFQGIELTSRETCLRPLNHWFVRHVERSSQRRGRLEAIWYSLVNDLALYLGELLIERTGAYRWVFDVDHDWVSVVSGSSHPNLAVDLCEKANGATRIELDNLLGDYAHAVVTGHHVDPEYFLNLFLAGAAAAPDLADRASLFSTQVCVPISQSWPLATSIPA